MEAIEQISPLRDRVHTWRGLGERIALVPTMGNLHAGHLTLVREACQLAARTVVSVFVNPLQFGPREDFGAYPRTLDRDRELLEAEGVDLLFAPPVEVVYPGGQERQTKIEVPGLSSTLCGASRPGHFVGVATVVCKLLNMAQPDVAVFGEKDFQQLMVIQRMVDDLCMPVDIQGVATVREADGLAMSSRNAYLTPGERARAPALYATLRRSAERLRDGMSADEVQRRAHTELSEAGFEPDYFSVHRARDLEPGMSEDEDLVILGAANLGKARLIDNLTLKRHPD